MVNPNPTLTPNRNLVMVALARKPKAKPARTLNVLSAVTDHLAVVRVTEGKRVDEYRVASADGAVFFTHREQPKERSYRVECVSGIPTECDCPTNPAKAVCRHIAAAKVLIERGYLAPPLEDEGYPEGWLAQTELE